jgi:hypothetical protein
VLRDGRRTLNLRQGVDRKDLVQGRRTAVVQERCMIRYVKQRWRAKPYCPQGEEARGTLPGDRRPTGGAAEFTPATVGCARPCRVRSWCPRGTIRPGCARYWSHEYGAADD